jgi:hypothetical protein
MSTVAPLDKLADDIRRIFAADPEQAETEIENYLLSQMGSLPKNQRVETLGQLAERFEGVSSQPTDEEQQVLSQLFSLVLGKKITPQDLSSGELVQRLAESLNTIFDALNRLVGLIQSTFAGQEETEQTIRKFIGFQFQGAADPNKSLEAYLGQISHAFLVAHQGSQGAAHDVAGRILKELDPAKFDENRKRGLKFGPLRKAELFDHYRDRYDICRKWFESGRFIQDFRREFEKHCQHNLVRRNDSA